MTTMNKRLVLLITLLSAHSVAPFLHSATKTFGYSTAVTSRLSAAASTITNVTIQVPQHYHGDDTEFPYPNQLHNIHIESMLTPAEAATSLQLARKYAAATPGTWETPDATRHETYPTCDFAMDGATEFSDYLEHTVGFTARMWKRLGEAYSIDEEDLFGYIDFFCVRYVAAGGDANTMDRLEAHRDGSILSFTVLLSPPEDFEGGGTFFDALRDEPPSAPALYPRGVIRPPHAGDAVLHSGKLLHGADIVTKGERVILVGFVDMAAWCERGGVLGEACKQFGRMDVASNRNEQQLKMMVDNNKKKGYWKARNKQFLPKTSCFRNVIPALEGASVRADPEYQRRFKLQAEDLLLRSILSDELPEYVKNSDVTVL